MKSATCHTLLLQRRLLELALVPATILLGCQTPQTTVATEVDPPAPAVDQPLAVRDPRAYVSHVAERCRALEQYTMIFTRTERRGLFQQLEGPERIRVWFRRSPFSVRMKWLDEDIKYGESTFVEGEHNNEVRFVTRWWSPPLKPPPQVNSFDVKMPVLLGEARRPLTEFGLEKMMDRIWAAVERSGDRVLISARGPEPLRPDGPMVYRLDLAFEPGLVSNPKQTLSIHADTNLPAGVILMREDGTLESEYIYEEIDEHAPLSAEDFLLTVERDPPATPPAEGEAATE